VSGEGTGLVLRGAVVAYGDHLAVDGVDLTVAPGRVVALLGRNGAGKSTVTSLAAGLLAPDSGHVRIDGADPRSSPDRGRLVGLAPQDIGVFPTLKVDENLRFFAELAGLRGPAAQRRTEELAERLHLTALLRRRAGQLSGGEQRRLHTAIAVVARPRVVLLDEPTAGADVQTRSAILDLVRSLAAEGTAVLYTTHYLPEVEELDAHVEVLHRGRIVAHGSVDELVAEHARATVVLEFHGDAPPFPGAATLSANQLTIEVDEPETAALVVLGQLGEHAARLAGLQLVRPSLETAFVALVGRAADGPAAIDDAPSPVEVGP
jgi:ABC-2 type transport system ATP-binding protein